MKRKMKSLLFITIVTTIVCIAGIANAYSVTGELNSSSKLKAGDIVEVTYKFTSVDAGDGIDSIEGALEYDKSVFEEVTEDSFEGLNKWKIGIYSTETQRFTVTKSEKITAGSDVFTISLKVKDTINKDSATIKIKDVFVSGGTQTGDIEVAEKSVTITKEETQQEEPKTNTEPTTNTITNTQPKTNTGAATGKIPQTGENTIFIVIGIAIIAVVTTIAYVKYRDLSI